MFGKFGEILLLGIGFICLNVFTIYYILTGNVDFLIANIIILNIVLMCVIIVVRMWADLIEKV